MKRLRTGGVLLGAGVGAVIAAAPVVAQAQEAREIGKVQYETYCGVCHGLDGKGDGPYAANLKTRPADLTQIQTLNGGRFPSARISAMIDGRDEVAAHGPRDMPLWRNVFKKQDRRTPHSRGGKGFYSENWRGRILAIIEYIQSLQVQ
jgi:mono/diheme cytochrome c family protein